MQTCVKYTSTRQVFSSWLSRWRTGGQGHYGPVGGPFANHPTKAKKGKACNETLQTSIEFLIICEKNFDHLRLSSISPHLSCTPKWKSRFMILMPQYMQRLRFFCPGNSKWKNVREIDIRILYCAAKMENNLRIHLSLHGFTLPANISWQIWKWDISNLSWWSVTNGHIQHFNNHLQIIIIILQFYIVE